MINLTELVNKDLNKKLNISDDLITKLDILLNNQYYFSLPKWVRDYLAVLRNITLEFKYKDIPIKLLGIITLEKENKDLKILLTTPLNKKEIFICMELGNNDCFISTLPFDSGNIDYLNDETRWCYDVGAGYAHIFREYLEYEINNCLI